MTSKQRAYLKGLASKIQPIFQIGKGGINDNLVQQLDDALEKRELIKVTVLENSMLDPRETCETCAQRTRCTAGNSNWFKICVISGIKKEKSDRTAQIEAEKAKCRKEWQVCA